eukprot:TRINITY_DN9900_c0_g1_i1.p1 TRINITY_DN9900_c0_g1~~TRINITY_DN9900_c0_g1_i1.p1  ORF type:complete len:233 (-),score=23.82 TRINITY_DN9900_c0_g1_i1:59-757(-)
MNDVQSWWYNLPLVTRVLFTGSVVLTLGANFGVIPPAYLVLHFPSVYSKLEIWRLVTSFMFHGKLGFPFLINMMFLVKYGQSLEREQFRETADYVFMVLFCSSIILVAAYFLNLMIVGMSLIMSIIYYWARKNPDFTMTFFFGLKFKSAYFPWVLIGFRILMGGMPIAEIVGAFVGHLYFFLIDHYPAQTGRRYLNTPQFLKKLFPPEQPINRPGQGPGQVGYNWGRGQVAR